MKKLLILLKRDWQVVIDVKNHPLFCEVKTKPILAGICFGISGVLAASIFVFKVAGHNWLWLIPTAALSAFIIATFFWSLLKCSSDPSILKGVLLGGLTGILSYPLMWYICFLGAWAFEIHGSLGEPTVFPFSLDALQGTLALSLFGIALTGWMVIPIAIVTGVLLSAIAKKR